MSTSAPQQQQRSQPIPPMIFAIGGAVTSAVLTGYGTFKGGNHFDDLPLYFGNLAIIVAATVLVYAVFVRRALHSDGARTATRTAVVLAMLAVATFVVFYLGLPAVLASGAVCTALAANHRAGRWTTATRVAMTLSAAAVVLATFIAITG